MKRDIERWEKCDPTAMAYHQSATAIMFALQDAKADILELHAEIKRLREDAERLTDEEIDAATAKESDDLLDHIYEYGTMAEGTRARVRKLARAAIDAAMQEPPR